MYSLNVEDMATAQPVKHTVLHDAIKTGIGDADPDAKQMSRRYIHYHRMIELCIPVEPNSHSISSQLTSKAPVIRK